MEMDLKQDSSPKYCHPRWPPTNTRPSLLVLQMNARNIMSTGRPSKKRMTRKNITQVITERKYFQKYIL